MRRPAGAHIQSCASSTDLLALHRHNPERYPLLLESTSGGQAQGRFDILFACPQAFLQLHVDELRGPCASGTPDFLQALDRWYASEQIGPDSETQLPFLGGWFFYLGYELAAQIEPRLCLPAAPDALPTALAVRCPAAVIRDLRTGGVYMVSEQQTFLAGMEADIAACVATAPSALPAITIEEDDPADYLNQVARVTEYIRAGDVFQVNLSREWRAAFSRPVSAPDVYAALRGVSPAPFSGLLQWQGAAVISSSPERLLRLQAGYADTRPIAGTRPRVGVDERTTRALLAHPKERAEHVMLIDLERNDLGRICEYGSVEVNELMALESYSHVHHIVSNVRGRLRQGVGPGAALRAVFPGGTITGCPKVRCMEIIAELEGQGRGAYTGAIGYLGRDGRLDSNILIRTLVQSGRQLRIRAGGGIVADSIAERELEETRAKARGMLQAIGATA